VVVVGEANFRRDVLRLLLGGGSRVGRLGLCLLRLGLLVQRRFERVRRRGGGIGRRSV
jgi:hypothetical protein